MSELDELKDWLYDGWDRAIFEGDEWVKVSDVLTIIDEFFATRHEEDR